MPRLLARYELSTRLFMRIGQGLATASLCLAGVVGAQAADAPKPDHSIKAPHYGDTLFYFFQDRPFPSLTSLMVSQQFERLPRHEDEAEILRGGLLLGYGLHREAGQIFEGLIQRGAEPAVRDRAWYFLAKIRYQRGSLEAAGQALDRIERELPGALEEERQLLDGQVRLALGDATGAATVLRPLLTRPPVAPTPPKVAGAAEPDKPGIFRRIGGFLVDLVTFDLFRGEEPPVSSTPAYARFNLGVALIRSGDVDGGRALLDELGKSPMPDEELRTLRDQANVALGFAALTQDDPEGAAKALERVRLQGVHSNKALLGFGWAAAAQKKPAEALVPWMELAGRDPSDAAVLEARIAVPYALAELGAYGQALARYQEAITTFDSESRALDESIAAIRGGRLVSGLAEQNPAEDMGWFLPVSKLPDMPHQGHLAPVLAGHDFQESFKNYRDLQFLAGNLDGWQDKLGIYRDMLDQRRVTFTERLPQVRQRASGLRVDGLQRQKDALDKEFQAAEVAADGVAYANPGERDALNKLDAAEALLTNPAAAAEVDANDVRERLRRLRGALAWQLAQEQPERRWAAEKGLRDTVAALDDARRHDASLAQAGSTEPAKFERFAARIDELAARIRALQPRVASLSTEQQNALQETAVVALQAQKERLVGYTNQARYAVAQLYDRATTKASPEGAK
jgi:TolA-binding protein